MKLDRSGLISLVYAMFVLLYTVYIIFHPAYFRYHRGLHWGYFLGFLLLSGYVFFIVQGIVLRSRNWGLIGLLPLLLLLAVILVGYILVGLIRLGGGDLLDRDSADMVLAAVLLLTGTFFSLRLIRPKKNRR